MVKPDKAGLFDPHREFRLGLVLSGGVSLATYINGTAYELERAVDGLGAYRWVKALTHAHIVVDVISGSSAGGINGVALAYALANGKSMAELAELWREEGDLEQLLRSRSDQGAKVNSALSGDAFQAKLENAFQEMIKQEDRQPDLSEVERSYRSKVEELDLFVTGTRLQPTKQVVTDFGGGGAILEDHRALFWLKHRGARKAELSPCYFTHLGDQLNVAADKVEERHQTHKRALAKLCRSTSSFPGAFPPVEIGSVRVDDELGEEFSADGLLKRWGRFPEVSESPPVHLMDGGVLDNKPFTSTLQGIFRRPYKYREVDRLLFYVEPHPTAAATLPQTEDVPPEPTFLSIATGALSGIPRSESIIDDLRLLDEHNAQVNRYLFLTKGLTEETWGAITTPVPAPAPAPAQPDSPAGKLYRQSRLLAIRDVIVDVLYAPSEKFTSEIDKAKIQELIERFDSWSQLSTNAQLLDSNDILFCRRRIEFFQRVLGEAPSDDIDPAAAEVLLASEGDASTPNLETALARHLEFYEAIEDGLRKLLQGKPSPPGAPLNVNNPVDWKWYGNASTRWTNIVGAIDRFEQLVAVLEIPNARSANASYVSVLNNFRRRVDNAVTDTRNGTSPGNNNLPYRLEERERKLIQSDGGGFAPDLIARYQGFRAVDQLLLPASSVAKLGERDRVDWVRISPVTAQIGFSKRDACEKIAGDELSRFGGFLKLSWRSNDILWGRLDGSATVIDTLLNFRLLDEELRDPGHLECILDHFFTTPPVLGPQLNANAVGFREAMMPSTLFPKCSEAAWRDLTDYLLNLLTLYAGNSSLESRQFARRLLVEQLVEMHQFEVLSDSIGGIVKDALTQQTEWNRFRAPATIDPTITDPLRWRLVSSTGDAQLDPLVALTAMADTAVATDGLFAQPPPTPGARRPTDSWLGSWFREDYKVGSEKLARDIPLVVLLGLLAQALLLVRTCLLNSLGEARRDRIKRNPIYKFGMDLPLRVVYRYARASRHYPGFVVGLISVVVTCSLLTIVLGIVFWSELMRTSPGDEFSPNRFLLLIGLPALLIVIGYKFLDLHEHWIPKLIACGQRFIAVVVVALVIGWVVYIVAELDVDMHWPITVSVSGWRLWFLVLTFGIALLLVSKQLRRFGTFVRRLLSPIWARLTWVLPILRPIWAGLTWVWSQVCDLVRKLARKLCRQW